MRSPRAINHHQHSWLYDSLNLCFLVVQWFSFHDKLSQTWALSITYLPSYLAATTVAENDDSSVSSPLALMRVSGNSSDDALP